VDFNATDLLLIRYLYLRRNGSTVGHTSALYIIRETYDSVRREVLYNSVIEFGIPIKLVGLQSMLK
jgi:hypothetical protein